MQITLNLTEPKTNTITFTNTKYVNNHNLTQKFWYLLRQRKEDLYVSYYKDISYFYDSANAIVIYNFVYIS